MQYVDLNIELAHLKGDKYEMKMHSKLGETQATIQLGKPETMEEMGRALWNLYTPMLPHEDRLPLGIYEDEFGGSMFRSIIDAKGARKLYTDTSTHASRRHMGMRVRLHIKTPELTFFPWGILKDWQHFEHFAYSEKKPMVRSQLVLPPAPRPERSYPLNILGLIDSRLGRTEEAVIEQRQLEKTLASLKAAGLIDITWVPGSSLEQLEQALQHGVWDVLYLIQPNDASRGAILTADSDGTKEPIGTKELANAITSHPSLQLVVAHVFDPCSTVAARLGDEKVPAILSLPKQGLGRNGLEVFLASFFRQVALGKPLEEAQAVARTALKEKTPQILQWAAPMLFLQAADGALFNLGEPPTRHIPGQPDKKQDWVPYVLEDTTYVYGGHAKGVQAVVWSSVERMLASADRDGQVHVWDHFDGEILRVYREHSSPVTALAWSPDDTTLASADSSGEIHVYPAKGEETLAHIQGQAGEITALAWSPDGTRLAFGCQDGTVQTWEAATENITRAYDGHQGQVTALCWLPGGKQIVSGDAKGQAHVWEVATGQKRASFDGHKDAITALCCSPTGRQVASVGADGTAQVWRVANGASSFVYRGHFGEVVKAVAWSPAESGQITTTGQDGVVHVWIARAGRTVSVYRRHAGPVTALAWAPDGKHIASASEDETVQLWRVRY
ncbi:MAG TPA: WD40 repeat domain-containing protein [Ktedonobacterales bacterium]|jgi:hypothetical protein